jgi:hypothetical protein
VVGGGAALTIRVQIADLRCREGTVLKRIGFWFVDGRSRCEPDVPDAIVSWAKEKTLGVVIWTGLPSSFRKKVNKGFSVKAAVEHVQGVPLEGMAIAATYVWRAPSFIGTKLRVALETEPWLAVDNVLI